MTECEQCNKSKEKNKMIAVKTDIVRYFCDWECLDLYCGTVLEHNDYETEL